MVNHALLVRMEARHDRSSEAVEFLASALPMVRNEPSTYAWFALRFGRGDYGIFDVFPDEAGRQAHLRGPVGDALRVRAPQLLDKRPSIEPLDVIAYKLPAGAVGAAAASCGLLLSFKAKAGREQQVEQFLREARGYVVAEPGTTAWFALRWPDGHYGVFDVFPDQGARFSHLTGHVPRELGKHAFTLLGGMPGMHMVDVMHSHFALMASAVAAAMASA